ARPARDRCRRACPSLVPMATREPSRSDGRRNRRSIIDAASRVLMDDPHASIHDIAAAAGLTRATVYRHFTDRDALIRAIVQQAAEEVVPALLEKMRPLPWGEALDLLADHSMTLGASYRDVILAAAHHPEDKARVAILGEPIESEIAAR